VQPKEVILQDLLAWSRHATILAEAGRSLLSRSIGPPAVLVAALIAASGLTEDRTERRTARMLWIALAASAAGLYVISDHAVRPRVALANDPDAAHSSTVSSQRSRHGARTSPTVIAATDEDGLTAEVTPPGSPRGHGGPGKLVPPKGLMGHHSCPAAILVGEDLQFRIGKDSVASCQGQKRSRTFLLS
jgi:hypothetical protein